MVAHPRPGLPDNTAERLPTGHPEALAVITIDSAGIIREFNAMAEALTGHSRDRALGASLGELIMPDRLRTRYDSELGRIRDQGGTPLLDHRVEVPIRRHDGTEIAVDLILTRVGPDLIAGLFRRVSRPIRSAADRQPSDALSRALIDRAPFMIAVVDADGRETWHSPSRADGAGRSDGSGSHPYFTDVVHPADHDVARQALRRATGADLTEPVELRVRASDGSWRAVSFLAVNLVHHPAVRGIVLYGQDITRARSAEQQTRVEAARMNILIEALGVGVMLQDEQGRVVLSNSAFVEMFALGLRPDRLRGTALRADSGRYADREAAARRTDETVSRGRPAIGEEFTLTDGRVVERDYVPITLDGTTLGHLWVFRDVTARADARRNLEERNRILTELSALKTEFVAVVSHELRTPLTSIATFASMADDGALSAEDRQHAIAAIRRNADRMLALVADLVLLAKLESGEIVLGSDSVNFVGLVDRAGADTAAGALTVTVSDGPPVSGDAELLRQAVSTVVGVVVSASDAGAPVIVEATWGGNRLPGWTLLVHTPTAEPASPERLLSTRLPHPDASGECRTGALALLLTREIAARHGGNLVTSVEGTTIAVTLRVPAAG